MKTHAGNRLAIPAAIGYALFAAAWILLSDELLSLFADVQAYKWVSMAKGLAFVLVTSVAFYLFVDGTQGRIAG
ncbi:MAG: hypothetical protein WCA32_03640, partial [Chromatiaceae bacterium]